MTLTKKQKFNNDLIKDCLTTFVFLLCSVLLEIIVFSRIHLGSPEYIGFNIVFYISVIMFAFAFPLVVKIILYSAVLIVQFAIGFVNTSYYYSNGNLFDLETTLQAQNGVQVATTDVFDMPVMFLMLALLIVAIVSFVLIATLIKTKKEDKIKHNILWLVVIVLMSAIVGNSGNGLLYIGLNSGDYIIDDWSGIALSESITMDDIKRSAENLTSEKYLYNNLQNKYMALKKFGTFGYYWQNLMHIFDGEKLDEEREVADTLRYLNSGGLATIKMGTSGGNNCVTILLETGSWWGIDPYMTPNLYALCVDSSIATINDPTMQYVADNTLKLENYYSRNSTNVSEQEVLVGNFPITNSSYYRQYIEQAKQLKFDFSFANKLKGESQDIVTTYLHPSTVNVYARDYSMPRFGFDNVYFIEDMEAFNSYTPYAFYNLALDSEFFESEMDRILPNSTRFYSHISTITTHGTYLHLDARHNERIKPYREKLVQNYDKVMQYYKTAMPTLNFPEKEQGDFYTEFLNYKSAYMDLDKAIGEFFTALSNRGMLDNTTVCLFSDHYCYYNDLAFKIFGYDTCVHSDLYRVPAFIFDSKLSKHVTANYSDLTKLHVTALTLPDSLLPTLMDILDMEYNPNYYTGMSIWDENTAHNVQISMLGGGISDKFFAWDYINIDNKGEYKGSNYEQDAKQFVHDMLYKYTKSRLLNNLYLFNEKIFK